MFCGNELPCNCYLSAFYCVRLEVYKALMLRIQVFWVVTLSSRDIDTRRLEDTYSPHLQGSEVLEGLYSRQLAVNIMLNLSKLYEKSRFER